MEKCKILKVVTNKEERTTDIIAEEIQLTLYASGEEIITLLASPFDIEELAVGFFFTSDIINSFSEIKDIDVDRKRWAANIDLRSRKRDMHLFSRKIFTSSCRPNSIRRMRRKSGAIKAKRGHIFSLMEDFQTRSSGFKETGCFHSAALADNNSIVAIREDIGRYNTIDKILGYALMNNIKMKNKIILSSGRLSSETVIKIQKTDIPIIASRSASTNRAIRLAENADITLIGFVRGRRMNIYSCKKRIL